MLEVSNISFSYGSARALNDVSISVSEGEFVAILGSNGAGKSTLLNLVVGLLAPNNGEIRFKQQRIDGTPTHEIWNRGLVLVPEGGSIFAGMTVQENLQLGARRGVGSNDVAKRVQLVSSYFPVLAERSAQIAGTLSGGERQQLAIGRALMGKPELLLLDEPTLGLAPLLSSELLTRIAQLRREEGMTLMLVSQEIDEALSLADRGYVLENGYLEMQGSSQELRNNAAVRAAYLGY